MASGLALGGMAFAAGPGRVAATGLWPLLERAGLAPAVAPLFAIVAAGAVTAALVQPLTHVRNARPWSAAIAFALLVVALFLPVPVAVLVATLPVAAMAGIGTWVVLAMIAAFALPPLGIVAVAVGAWRSMQALRLPACANDNHALHPGGA